MGASVRPIPASLRDAITRAVVPQSTQVGMGRPVTLSAPFANLPLSRMGPQVPGAIPLPQGTLPDQTQDVGSIARAVAGAVGQGTGITPAFHAGQALSSGRGFDRLGGKQPIAGPLLTAALAAAPLAAGEAGPMVRAIGDEATAGVKALAPEFTSVVSDALWRARINDLNARDVLRSALKAQESPLGPMEIRTSASSAAPGQGYLPSRTVPPDAAAVQQMEIPTTARRSVAQAVMDSVFSRAALPDADIARARGYGAMAARAGQDVTTNPYRGDSPLYAAWRAGHQGVPSEDFGAENVLGEHAGSLTPAKAAQIRADVAEEESIARHARRYNR